MPDAVTRAFSIQNSVPSFRCVAADRSIWAVTTTWERSSLRLTLSTTPSETSRYLMRVLPGSRPAAVSNVIVIDGPSLLYVFQASHAATTAARAGISHTSGRPRRASTSTSGTVSSGRFEIGSVTVGSSRVPDETRVEGHGGEHGEDDDAAERDRPGARRDRRDGVEAHERDENGEHEDVDHRPAADRLDDAVEGRAVAQPPRRA